MKKPHKSKKNRVIPFPRSPHDPKVEKRERNPRNRRTKNNQSNKRNTSNAGNALESNPVTCENSPVGEETNALVASAIPDSMSTVLDSQRQTQANPPKAGRTKSNKTKTNKTKSSEIDRILASTVPEHTRSTRGKKGSRDSTASPEDLSFKTKLPKGFFYMVFKIQNWKKWDYEIMEAVETFRKKYPVYPHILLASTATLNMFDMVAFSFHPENLRYVGPPEEEPPEPILEPGGGIAAIEDEKYRLELCILEEAPLGYYVLIYDSDPNGGDDLPDFGFQDLSGREWLKQSLG